MRITRCLAASLITSAMLTAGDAGAANKTWIGPTGNWTTPGNWSPFGAPLDFDNVFLRTNDATPRIVSYNVNSGFFHLYNQLWVQSPGTGGMEFRALGNDMEMDSLVIGSAGAGTATYLGGSGGSTLINTGTVGIQGRLTLRGGPLQATNFTLDGGGVGIRDRMTVTGTFRFNSGSIGSTDVDVRAGTLTTMGTLLASATYFGCRIENHGTLILNPTIRTTFAEDVWNYASNTLDRDLRIQRTFAQMGGATWRSDTNVFSSINFETVTLGSVTQEDPVSGPGTYLLAGGNVGASTIRIGVQTDGTFTQNAGKVTASDLFISLGNGVGHYQLNGGSLQTFSSTTIGSQSAAFGRYVQAGGVATLGTVVMNVDSTSNALLTLSGGAMTFKSLLNNGTYDQTGGAASTVGNIDGAGAISVTGTGTLSAARIRQQSVSIGGGGRISIVIPTTPLVSPANRVQSLTMEQAGAVVHGTWDLNSASLIIDYSGASPGPDVQRYLRSGFAGGSWNGTGLASSAAAADAQRRHALGFAEGVDLFGSAGGVFDGVFVDSSSIVVAYTIYGDTNLDGIVNLADFNRLAGNFGGSNKTWSHGDFNYDGVVNLSDFNRLAASFGFSAAGPEVTPDDWSALASAVPEPSGLAVAMGMAAAVTWRGRRRR
jgi:hypothetical protein